MSIIMVETHWVASLYDESLWECLHGKMGFEDRIPCTDWHAMGELPRVSVGGFGSLLQRSCDVSRASINSIFGCCFFVLLLLLVVLVVAAVVVVVVAFCLFLFFVVVVVVCPSVVVCNSGFITVIA